MKVWAEAFCYSVFFICIAWGCDRCQERKHELDMKRFDRDNRTEHQG